MVGYVNSRQTVAVTSIVSTATTSTTTSISYDYVTSSTANAVLLSDSYAISGTAGSRYGCYTEYSHTDKSVVIGAGQRITIKFSATNSVNFWVLSDSQYSTWKPTYQASCSRALGVPSVLLRTEATSYTGAVQLPISASYHFVFDNDNPGPVTVTVIVTGPGQATELVQSAATETMTFPTYETRVEIRSKGFGLFFYLGLVSMGVAFVLVMLRRGASRADYTRVYD
jgi:hypothetical protein